MGYKNYSVDGESLIRDSFVETVQKKVANADNKVSIIGAGKIGAACAYGLLSQGITNDICMVDTNDNHLEGEYFDLLHASASIRDLKIAATQDYEATAGSKVTVVTIGSPEISANTIQLLERSTELIKTVIPEIMKHSPQTILYIITNPCDVMTYLAWKLSKLPKHKVIGTGTELDSTRLRVHIAKRLGVSVSSCRAWMLGEHGDSMVPMWSTVSIAGVRLFDLNAKAGTPDDPDRWHEIGTEAIEIGRKIIFLKGGTVWGISSVVCKMIRAILSNTNEIYAASTYAKGFYGIPDEVFLSLPVALGSNGVTDVIKLTLTERETKGLRASASILLDVLENKLKLQ